MADQIIQWTTSLGVELEIGFYTNDVIDETQQQIDENYLGNYSRLLALKNKYDPTNLFRLNANVIPRA